MTKEAIEKAMLKEAVEETIKKVRITKAIGIDPDAMGFQCFLLDLEKDDRISKRYLSDQEGLTSFRRWVTEHHDAIICIEGKDGQSLPIERALFEDNRRFFSLSPLKVKNYRTAVLGEAKNNEKDAEAVARFGIDLANQKKIKVCERTVDGFPRKIRSLSRLLKKITGNRTASINSLWKCIHAVSSDLYLTLRGKNPNEEKTTKILGNKGVLNLLVKEPDVTQWQHFDEEKFLSLMGGQNYRGRKETIKKFQGIASCMNYTTTSDEILIRSYAQQILLCDTQSQTVEKELTVLTEEDVIIKDLLKYKGIGLKTAATIRGEILNPDRFKTDGNLASYSGLVRKEDSTGENSNTKPNLSFNRRLKDAFLTAAKSLITHKGDAHLVGYYQDLRDKRKLKETEAYKRVARALVRRIFKEIIAPNKTQQGGAEIIKERE